MNLLKTISKYKNPCSICLKKPVCNYPCDDLKKHYKLRIKMTHNIFSLLMVLIFIGSIVGLVLIPIKMKLRVEYVIYIYITISHIQTLLLLIIARYLYKTESLIHHKIIEQELGRFQ